MVLKRVQKLINNLFEILTLPGNSLCIYIILCIIQYLGIVFVYFSPWRFWMEEWDLIYLYFGFLIRFVMQIMFLPRKHIHLTLSLALLSDELLLFSVLMLSNPPVPNIHCMTRGHHWLQIHARHLQKWNSTLRKQQTFGDATTAGFTQSWKVLEF